MGLLIPFVFKKGGQNTETRPVCVPQWQNGALTAGLLYDCIKILVQ